MMHDMGMWHGLGMLIWGAVWIAILGFAIYGISRMTRRRQRKSSGEILEERYARGEIDKAELEAKRRDLSA